MSKAYDERVVKIQSWMRDENVDFFVLCDPDTIYYASGLCGDLGMDFGRPMILVIPRTGGCTVITPLLEDLLVKAMVSIEDIRSWMDGSGTEWCKHLNDLFKGGKRPVIGVEQYKTPLVVFQWLQNELGSGSGQLMDITDFLSDLKMIKSEDDINIMRQAGQVAVAMAEAAAETIAEGVPEYEIALAVMAGGTRKAASYFSEDGPDLMLSPMIHDLQVINSGTDTQICHRRNSIRKLRKGDPVYLCFCTVAKFKQFKLGFDREWFVGEAKEEHARVYEVCLKAQQTGLDMIRPGIIAEDVHNAVNQVYRDAGFEAGYRTGRATGYACLEKPELKTGDLTPLEKGMTLCLDGGITIPGEFGARVGDSFVVTDTGLEILTPYPKDLKSLTV
jgi:Xaa-Pro aminopeptidase